MLTPETAGDDSQSFCILLVDAPIEKYGRVPARQPGSGKAKGNVTIVYADPEQSNSRVTLRFACVEHAKVSVVFLYGRLLKGRACPLERDADE